MQIRPFLEKDVEAVKKFTDEQIGVGYYSLAEQYENQKKSIASTGEITSFILIDETQNNKITGLRLAFPPGNWAHGKGNKLRPDLWPFQIDEAAYFQSLFLAEEAQGQQWGPKLSELSMNIFKKLGAKGIITHCWKESPHNSSLRYLEKVGFKKIIEHQLYWIDVDYTCTHDGKPCRCTAIEMHLTL